MGTSFADYCATQDARNTLQLKVREWTLMLCDALEHDYIETSVKRQKRPFSRTVSPFPYPNPDPPPAPTPKPTPTLTPHPHPHR